VSHAYISAEHHPAVTDEIEERLNFTKLFKFETKFVAIGLILNARKSGRLMKLGGVSEPSRIQVTYLNVANEERTTRPLTLQSFFN
jgi:hypothetical protein